MRLDAVYVLAPKPAPPSMPTRRAFLLAGGTFVAGLGVGGACGYAAGVSPSAGGNPESKLPESSGNAELDELRRLALVAPIEELVEKWLYFVDLYATSYRKDEVLVAGIERLVKFILSHPEATDRKVIATFLAQAIERGEDLLRSRLESRIEELRRVR